MGGFCRNDSARDLAQLAGHFDAVNRFVVHQRLSSRNVMVETQAFIGKCILLV